MQVVYATMAILDQYLVLSRVVIGATAKRYTHSYTAAPHRGKLVTLVAGCNKRRRLLFAGDGRRRSVYDKKPQRYAKHNGTESDCTQW